MTEPSRPRGRWHGRWRGWWPLRDDDGSASLEFLGAGLLLLVPLIYLVITVQAIQSASLATAAAARQSARVYVQADSVTDAEHRAAQAIDVALADHGLHLDDADVVIDCRDRCLEPESFVSVRVAVDVPLPLIPAFIGDLIPLSVPVGAESVQRVSRFAGAS